MGNIIGQRWEVLQFAQNRFLTPRMGEMVCIQHPPEFGTSVIPLMGNGTLTVERLLEEWRLMTNPRVQENLVGMGTANFGRVDIIMPTEPVTPRTRIIEFLNPQPATQLPFRVRCIFRGPVPQVDVVRQKIVLDCRRAMRNVWFTNRGDGQPSLMNNPRNLRDAITVGLDVPGRQTVDYVCYSHDGIPLGNIVSEARRHGIAAAFWRGKRQQPRSQDRIGNSVPVVLRNPYIRGNFTIQPSADGRISVRSDGGNDMAMPLAQTSVLRSIGSRAGAPSFERAQSDGLDLVNPGQSMYLLDACMIEVEATWYVDRDTSTTKIDVFQLNHLNLNIT